MDEYDLAIIGAGPAALTAAIYAGRYGMKAITIERQVIGGQVATTDWIENYPGFFDGVAGLELADKMAKQAEKFGVPIKIGSVTDLENIGGKVLVKIDTGDLMARTALIATGASYRHLDIAGEKDHAHYCATCDGAFYKGKKLVTIGGGNTAVQEALYLSYIASHITMLVRSYIKADQFLTKRLTQAVDEGRITVLEGWRPIKIVEDDSNISGVKAVHDDQERLIQADGLFVFAGQVPNTGFLSNTEINMDSNNYIIADYNLRTNLPNIWVAGDVRVGASRQIATAAADGVTAVKDIYNCLMGRL